MAVNCTLHRSNRISTILTLLPGTVHLLGKELRATADRFWTRFPVPDFTTRREIRRFCTWLLEEVDGGRVGSPYLSEMVGWELAQYELRMMPRKRTLTLRANAIAEPVPGYSPVVPPPTTRATRPLNRSPRRWAAARRSPPGSEGSVCTLRGSNRRAQGVAASIARSISLSHSSQACSSSRQAFLASSRSPAASMISAYVGSSADRVSHVV